MTTIKVYNEVVSRVHENLPSCPTPTILNHIRNAAIRACEQTLVWRHSQPSYNLIPGVHEYPYQKPKGTDVHAVFSAAVNGYPLQLVTLDEALDRFPAFAEFYGGLSPEQLWSNTPSGALNAFTFNNGMYNENPDFKPTEDMFEGAAHPQYFTQLTPDKFVVLPQPDNEKEYKLKLVYALKPKRSATGMPQEIFDELEDAIVHSALQSLLALPGNPWTDRQMAGYHGQQARYHLSERRARANLGNARGPLTVKMVRWA